uniref:Lysozyme n=1 Tax=Naja naja TaxID=35670 RepID=A0A8C6X539_NAJNA
MKALALTFLFLLIAVNEAKVFTKCELASILKGKGMDGYHGYSLGNWICMAYHESRYNSRAVGPRNSDGSRDYGIFQINSRYWCKNNQGPTANGCNKPCSGKTPNNDNSFPGKKETSKSGKNTLESVWYKGEVLTSFQNSVIGAVDVMMYYSCNPIMFVS